MDADLAQLVEGDSIETPDPAAADAIEQTIEQVGARYIEDLRMLSKEFERFYEAQLAAKDARIAELSRLVKAADRERDTLEQRLRDLQRSGERYITDLRALSQELSRRLEVGEDEDTALEERSVGQVDEPRPAA
jgi:hypothetical protein